MIKAHDHFVNSIVFSKKNNFLLTGSADFYLNIWDSKTY